MVKLIMRSMLNMHQIQHEFINIFEIELKLKSSILKSKSFHRLNNWWYDTKNTIKKLITVYNQSLQGFFHRSCFISTILETSANLHLRVSTFKVAIVSIVNLFVKYAVLLITTWVIPILHDLFMLRVDKWVSRLFTFQFVWCRLVSYQQPVS